MIIIILFVVLLIICLYTQRNTLEYMINIPKIDRKVKWTVNRDCNYLMGETIKNVLESNGIKNTEGDDWVLYIPCTYNNMTKEINDVIHEHPDQRVYIIDNGDQISGKNTLWSNLVSSYGRDISKDMMPNTYILYDDDDRNLFKKEYDPKKLYIMKKNIQRQKGLLITNNKQEILDGSKEQYVVVQELLQDPYLIDGRKINMRFYLLVICHKGDIDAYVHNDGFMYYTAEKFKENSKDTGPNVTTGYIDRKVYEVNPLTHMDFRKYLDKKDRQLSNHESILLTHREILSKHFFESVYDLLSDTIAAMKGKICYKSHLDNVISFQLFGVDIAVNNKLKPQIMEINKGPDLGAKDGRDKDVKYTVVTDVLKVMKLIPDGSGHGFIKVLE